MWHPRINARKLLSFNFDDQYVHTEREKKIMQKEAQYIYVIRSPSVSEELSASLLVPLKSTPRVVILDPRVSGQRTDSGRHTLSRLTHSFRPEIPSAEKHDVTRIAKAEGKRWNPRVRKQKENNFFSSSSYVLVEFWVNGTALRSRDFTMRSMRAIWITVEEGGGERGGGGSKSNAERFESILNIKYLCTNTWHGGDRVQSIGRFAREAIMFFHDTCIVIFARAAREPSTLHVN